MHRARHARSTPACQPSIGGPARRLRWLLVLLALVALGACYDAAAPTQPLALQPAGPMPPQLGRGNR